MGEVEPGEDKPTGDEESQKISATKEYARKVAIYDAQGNLAEERFITSASDLDNIIGDPLMSDITENEEGTIIIKRK